MQVDQMIDNVRCKGNETYNNKQIRICNTIWSGNKFSRYDNNNNNKHIACSLIYNPVCVYFAFIEVTKSFGWYGIMGFSFFSVGGR